MVTNKVYIVKISGRTILRQHQGFCLARVLEGLVGRFQAYWYIGSIRFGGWLLLMVCFICLLDFLTGD